MFILRKSEVAELEIADCVEFFDEGRFLFLKWKQMKWHLDCWAIFVKKNSWTRGRDLGI